MNVFNREWMITFRLAISLLVSMFSAESVKAAPFAKWITVPLEGGRTVRIWGEGDEFSAHFESEDGYALVYDDSLRGYTYARKDPQTGALVSTGIKLGDELRCKRRIMELSKHERDTSELYNEKRRRRLAENDELMGTARRWRALKERNRIQSLKSRGVTNAPSAQTVQPAPPSKETTGTVVGLALLIDFPGESGTTGTLASQVHPGVTKQDVDNLFNADSFTKYGNASSVRKYFEGTSCGNLCYTNIVLGWFTMPHPRSYYDDITNNDIGACARPLIIEAFRQMREDPLYSVKYEPLLRKLTLGDYSAPKAVNVYFAGESSTRWDHGLWAHAGSFWGSALGSAWYKVDGVIHDIYRYQITPVTSSPSIATICHESAHMALGFPDLYHYGEGRNGNSEGNGVGNFCLMSGSTSDTNPQYINPYLRAAAGWITPKELTSSPGKRSVSCALSDVWKWTNEKNPQEYYLIENRRKKGRDVKLPAEGILIWRCDETGDNTASRYIEAFSGTSASARRSNELSLEQADGQYSIERKMGRGDGNDAWFSDNTSIGFKSRFDDLSVPCAKWADGSDSDLCLTGFSGVADTMEFYIGEAPMVTVVFDPGDGDLLDGVVRKVPGAVYGELPVPVRCGYGFSGWENPSGVIVSKTSSVPDSDVTLTARWSKRSQSEYADIAFGIPRSSGWSTEVFLSDATNKQLSKTSFHKGDDIRFSAGYKNSGQKASAKSFDIRFSILKSNQETVSNWTYTHEETMPARSATTYWGGGSWSALSSLQNGCYVYRVELDVSHDIDEYDESDNIREFAFSVGTGESTSCRVNYDANGGSGSMATTATQKGIVTRLRKNAYARKGYDFLGWSKEFDGTYEYADGGLVRFPDDTTLYAVWKARQYVVTFDVCGGSSVTRSVTVAYGKRLWDIPEPTRAGYDFAGWFTMKSGGTQVTSETVVTDNMTVYAQWKKSALTLSLDSSVVLASSGGNVVWNGQTLVSKDGKSAAQSGNISHNQNSWMEIGVEGPSMVSFWWKVSSEGDYDQLTLYLNGTMYETISGEVGWTKVELELPLGSHTLRWNYSKDYSVSRGMDCGWVDQVSVTGPLKCKVTFNADGGTVSPANREVLKGDVVGKLPIPTRDGWRFLGWCTAKTGGTIVSNATVVTKDVTYYARWDKHFTLILEKNDGTGTSVRKSVVYGCSTALPGVASDLGWAPRRGFSFMGWATSEKSKNVWLKDKADVATVGKVGDTLRAYAIWQLKTATSYAIQYIRNDGSGSVRTIGFNGGVATKLNSVKALGFERRGYTFVGWATSTADARAKKVWKKDMGVVSQPVANGKLLQIYAIWKLTPGYYSIRFNKNDGSGKWRELGYKYGDNTTLPTIENGLQWSRAGYRFGGWATSAANAAKGIVWRGDKGVTRTPVAAGKTLNVYAIWKKIGASVTEENAFAQEPMSLASLPSSGAGGPVKLLPGYYSGELADGTGMYDLLVDESGETGYVHIFFDDGSALSSEVDIDILGDIILVSSEDGEMTPLRYNQ